jgi:type IV secretory pathway VirB4 component
MDPNLFNGVTPFAFIPVALGFGAAAASAYSARLLAPPHSHASMSDRLKWAAIGDDNATIRCTNGVYFRVYTVAGPHYTATQESRIANMLTERREWFLAVMNTNVSVRFLTRHAPAAIPEQRRSGSILDDLNDKWTAALAHTYATRHSIILSVEGKDNLAGLEAASQSLEQRLQQFNPVLLTNKPDEFGFSPLASFLSELLTNTPALRAPLRDDVAKDLSTVHVEPDIDGQIATHDSALTQYSRCVTVLSLGQTVSMDVLNALASLDHEYDFMIHTRPLPKQIAHERTVYRAKQAALRLDNKLIRQEWEDTRDEIHAERETLCTTEVFVFPRASSDLALKAATAAICGALGAKGIATVVERNNAMRAYSLRWPGYETFVRARDWPASYVAELAAMPGHATGQTASVWGPRPIRYVPIAGDRSPYALTYHPTAGDDSSPHDIRIAGTSSGKTVWDCFMGSGAHSAHPELRQLLFDRNQGLKVYTHFLDGQYLIPETGTLTLNPFDLEDSPQNRQMQVTLLSLLANKDDPQTVSALETAVKHAASNMDPKDRTLEAVYTNLIPPGPLKQALAPWVSGEKYGRIFTGEVDAFHPDRSRITTIALDTVIDDPRLAGILAFYFLRRIQSAFVANGYPYRITVDEASTLLADQSVADLVLSEVRTARKNKGQVSTIWQDFRSVRANPVGEQLAVNAGTLYAWPNTAETHADCESLGIFNFTETEREFLTGNWRPPNSVRPVLLKRENESVFLETDLSALGPYLRAFIGGSETKKRYEECVTKYGQQWRPYYLGLV